LEPAHRRTAVPVPEAVAARRKLRRRGLLCLDMQHTDPVTGSVKDRDPPAKERPTGGPSTTGVPDADCQGPPLLATAPREKCQAEDNEPTCSETPHDGDDTSPRPQMSHAPGLGRA